MDDNNLPETEKLISSFTKITSSSRETAISLLATHQWNLNAAVSNFTKNGVAVATTNAAKPNVSNPSDEQLVRRNLSPFPNLRIKIPVSYFSPFDGSSYSPGRLWLRSSPSRGRSYLEPKSVASKNPFSRQTIKCHQGAGKRKFADFSGGTGSNSDEAMKNYDGEDNSDIEESSRSMSEETDSAEFDEEESQKVITYIVTSWRNGYTVDDGPLETLDDPEKATFFEIISRLESPRDLGQVCYKTKLIRRENENYIEPQAESGSASTEPPALAASPPMRAIERPEESSSILSGETVSPELQEQQQQDQPREVVIIVTIWRNGFTIDDNPLESLDDPDNAAFIERITKLESPRIHIVRVQVKLIRREEEDFTESPSFHSVERTLPGPDSVSTEPPVLLATSRMGVLVIIDHAAPTTSVQLRLADGTSIDTQFNTHHTVRDVRSFIDASRPDDSKDYQLFIMGFPHTPLLDFDQTIEKAGIANNSVLIQKF